MTTHIRQDAGRSASAEPTKKAAYPLRAGIAAALLLSCSPAALHAETSNAELAKEIAELKAQIRDLRGSVTATRVETRREVQKVKAVASRTPVAPPPAFAYPEGAVPAFVTADKKLVFGGITITPGGFFEAASVFRSRATGAELGTSFNGIPFPNAPSAHTNEFRFSARQSRPALLVEGAITPSLIASGYAELDFLGAAQTANNNQTNSYQPRIRNLYAALDSSEYGMHVLAGQNWSLLTLNSKGITPRNEVLPPTIDAQQNVGSLYARQAQIRLVKDFNKKLWIGISAEESSTTSTTAACNSSTAGAAAVGATIPGTTAITCGVTGSTNYSGLSTYSLNHVPDVVGKVAYEARLADRDVHIEAEGIYRDFYDRVQTGANSATISPAASSKNTSGYGIGGGLIVPVIPKRVDFQINGLLGRGIGRYGPGQLPDTTFGADGSERPIRGAIALTGLTLHATPSIDVYAFAGIEKNYSSKSTTTAAGLGGTTGLGASSVNGVAVSDAGCFVESTAAAACNGQTRRLYELTGGVWDKIYKGSFGEVRAGLQYSYVNREVFNAPGLATVTATNHVVFTSLRYYPFQ